MNKVSRRHVFIICLFLSMIIFINETRKQRLLKNKYYHSSSLSNEKYIGCTGYGGRFGNQVIFDKKALMQHHSHWARAPPLITSLIVNISQQIFAKLYQKRFDCLYFFANEKRRHLTVADDLWPLSPKMWRIASLYGIAKTTNRKIFFQNFAVEAHEYGYFLNLTEFEEIFPSILNHIHVKNPNRNTIRNVTFAEDCCKYDYVEKLLQFSDDYVQIKAEYFQSYKFFQPYRNDIKLNFDCSQSIMSEVKKYSSKLIELDNSQKLCVHIRREDFLTDVMQESTSDFVIPAIDYAYKHLFDKDNSTKVSLLFFGNDQNFSKNLKLQKEKFHKIYFPELNTRGEDMCFGINNCDAMLLTASGSTFGWWMAYLMKSNGPVFYNSQVTKNQTHSKDIHDFDYFPGEWIKLTIKDKKAINEPLWWYQRNNALPDLPSKEL